MLRLLQSATDLATSLQSLQYTQRLQVTLAASVACSVYLSVVVRRVAPSYASLVTIIPVLVVNALVPVIYPKEEVLGRICWSLLLMWLASFKAIGLCLGRGPLVGSWNIPQTVLLYTLPIYPCQECEIKKGRLTDSHGSTFQAIKSFLSNTLMLGVFGYVLSHELPGVLRHYVCGLALASFITFLMDGPAALLIGALNMQVVPSFDKPWFSTSVADFWGRRWNNTTGLTLRALVYDPIVERRIIPASAVAAKAGGNQQAETPTKVPKWLRLLGMHATFAVSGIMHEIMLYLLVLPGQYRPGFWLAFFTIQAPIMILEGLVLKKLRSKGIVLPWVVANVGCMSLILATAYCFWYPPIEQHSEVAANAVASINASVKAVGAMGYGLMEQWKLDESLCYVMDWAREAVVAVHATLASTAVSA